MIYFTIYKTVNKINNKFYYGKHKTKNLNDNYLGSGSKLNEDIKKFGKNSFKKEILYVFDNEDEMNEKEKEIITNNLLKDQMCYNMSLGGYGSWSHINKFGTKLSKETKEKISKALNGRQIPIETRKRMSEAFSKRTHSDKTKEKIRNSGLGNRNSCYNTTWITNGKDNKRIKKEDDIPVGWKKGRTV